MKVGIVKFSCIQRSKFLRLDAGHYLGTIDHKEADKAVAEAEKRVEMAKKRLATARQKKRESEERVKQMIKAGDLRLL